MTAHAQDTVRIQSAQYGELEFQQEQIYTLPKGLVGMEKNKQFGLLSITDSPLYILHALDQEVSFVIVPAAQVVKDYEFDITPEAIELLEAKSTEDIHVFLIVNFANQELYVNLKAPLLLSPKVRLGLQYVIHDQNFPIRQRLQLKGSS